MADPILSARGLKKYYPIKDGVVRRTVGHVKAVDGVDLDLFGSPLPREDGLTVEELRAFCRERLTGYKVPREILFRAELPKSNVGKVLRRSLKDSLGS